MTCSGAGHPNQEFTYYDGMIRIPEGSAPDIKNKSFGISAEVTVPEKGAEGLIMTQGGRFAGFGLYLLEGKPVFHYNLCGVERYNVVGAEPLKPGKHVITLDFNYDGGGVGKGGTATLTVDGKQVVVLVPTTVLAFQHMNTFRARFADYPFRIASVSRFKTAGEARALLREAAVAARDVADTYRLEV